VPGADGDKVERVAEVPTGGTSQRRLNLERRDDSLEVVLLDLQPAIRPLVGFVRRWKDLATTLALCTGLARRCSGGRRAAARVRACFFLVRGDLDFGFIEQLCVNIGQRLLGERRAGRLTLTMMPSAFICERRKGQRRSASVQRTTHLQRLVKELLNLLGIVVGTRRNEVVPCETNVGGLERRESLMKELATTAEGKTEEALQVVKSQHRAFIHLSNEPQLTSPLRYMRSKA